MSLLSFTLATLLASAGPSTASIWSAARAPMLGFSPEGERRQRRLEQRFDSLISTAEMDGWMLRMASKPNQVGSPHDRENAEWQLAQFKAWGWNAHIETFRILYGTPRVLSLGLVGPGAYQAKLHEPGVAGDQTAADQPGVLPPYLLYQGDGDVTAPLVYANFGMPEDYRTLARQNVNLKGRIVIVRYGGGFRGLKVKLAQEHGAVGCIIYSDPHEDGYYAEDTYPKGSQRPADGVQRGSVADMMTYAGDPLTPGVGATDKAARLTRQTAPALMRIPALAISYADAQPFLAALGGPVAEPAFRGALPITYHVGPGPAVAHLVVKSDWSLQPIYDVVAKIEGSLYPDQWVLRGNHHDGWVFGAEDPLSGQVALMAEAKAIGAAVNSGWRPKRTLIYTSWDGEEAGISGSTEWAETHADELRAKAVLYVNSDSIDRGFVDLQGSHELQTLANQVSADVMDPETHTDLRTRLRGDLIVKGLKASGSGAGEAQALGRIAAAGGDLPLKALGSGSDFTPFLQHLGVPSMNIIFGGEGRSSGVYHSAYDTHDHYVRFGDPGMRYSAVLARTAGRIIMRYADADLPSVNFIDFAGAISGYVGELHGLEAAAREQAQKNRAAMASGAYALAADPLDPQTLPEPQAEVRPVALTPLDRASARLKLSAARVQQLYVTPLSQEQETRLGQALQGIDLTLLDPKGLPGRPWYRHMIYAPGLETGYSVKTLPAVREAIEAGRWAEADRYATLTAAVLDAYSDRLDKAWRLLAASPATPSAGSTARPR
ncbi:transferrin receptor-like dimerization domain-containing protein [Caulobacter sp. S45]|uniref:transferrin receptor-like dimerization domain-containing protein n=1 Tax=Caulobacter sp. S45 TaxID=1641861 RepID=UPI001574F797|nr:transferrin receptor-like dimerization domain-containing protein [Caulobacter sp. S45]